MSTQPFSARLAFCLVLAGGPALAAPTGIPPQPPPDLPGTLTEVQLTIVEISWDFGDVVPFDWRTNLTSSDLTAFFRFRWRYSGPGFDHAVIAVADANGSPLGEVPLPLTPIFADGFRYSNVTIGDLPGTPTLELRVVLKDNTGSPIWDKGTGP